MSQESPLPLQMQALLNRLRARLGSGVADAAASVLAAAEGAPSRLSREWQLFWQEVELEAQRLEQGESAPAEAAEVTTPPQPPSASPTQVPPLDRDPQTLIDSLRARVASLSHSLDA